MRHNDTQKMEPAELAVQEAIKAVEAVGADILLTDAIISLIEAKRYLRIYFDNKLGE